MSDAALPSFERPPVHEVAMGLVFAPIKGFQSRHFGAMWEAFKERYPTSSEHPPIQAQIEQFGVPGRQQIGLQLLQRPELRRQWFVASNDIELIQVQDDRFVRNWRKRSDNRYPRFESLLKNLGDDWNQFTKVLESEGLPEPKLIQCELDYVNHVDDANGFESYANAGTVFHPMSSGFSDEFLDGQQVDDVSVRFSFPMKAKPDSAQPIGRLRVSLESGVTLLKPPKPLLQFTLTARGRPLGEGWQGAKAFFEVGREWIVRGFKSATTARAHDIWGGPAWDESKPEQTKVASGLPGERKRVDG